MQLKTVFGFEYFSYIKSKGYIIATIILALLAAGLSIVPTVMGLWGARDPSENRAVIVIQQQLDTDQAFGEIGWVRTPDGAPVDVLIILEEIFHGYEFRFMHELDEAKSLLGEYSFVLAVNRLDDSAEENFTLYVQNLTMTNLGLESTARQFMARLWQYEILTDLRFEPEQLADFFDMQPAGSITAVGGGEPADFIQNYAYAYVMVFLLYLSIAMYGQFIATSVVTEKSSKAMELLITSVKPLYLMLGKVLGVTAAGLTQLAAIIIAALGSFFVNAHIWAATLEISAEDMALANQWAATLNAPDMMVRFMYLIIFYLLGFLLYAFMYAAFASTADRMEDVNNTQGYPMLFLMAAFFMAIFGMMDAGAAWMTVASYVPFFTPILMLTRFIMGTAGHAEMLAAIALMAVSVLLMAYISAKIYRMGVLMYGKKVAVGELVRIIRAARV